MVAPLNLDELDIAIPRLAFRFFKNANRVLLIKKDQVAHRVLPTRWLRLETKTLLQL